MAEELKTNTVYITKPEECRLTASDFYQTLNTVCEAYSRTLATLDQLTSTLSVMSDRMDALEKQVRLERPVTSKQAAYLNAVIRQRAQELLEGYHICDGKAVTKLSGVIRKTVLIRYGIGTVREIPKCEYSVAMYQITTWNDLIVMHDIVTDWRNKQENEKTEETS